MACEAAWPFHLGMRRTRWKRGVCPSGRAICPYCWGSATTLAALDQHLRAAHGVRGRHAVGAKECHAEVVNLPLGLVVEASAA